MLTEEQWQGLPVLRIADDGTPVRQQIFADVWGSDTCDPELIIGDICRYDYAPHMTAVPATERISFNYNGVQEITGDIEGFAEFSAQHASTFIQVPVAQALPNYLWMVITLITRYSTTLTTSYMV